MLRCRPIQLIEYLTQSAVGGDPATAHFTDSRCEPPARWWCPGSWIAPDGEVAAERPIIRLAQGQHPYTGRKLITGNMQAKRQGFDLTFSSPKCFGVLWAVATLEERDRLERMLLSSVRATLDRILAAGLIEARRRIGGRSARVTREPVANAVAALFLHRTSRAGDPHPHVHAALLMAGQRTDGTVGAINNERIMQSQMVLGALFRLELALQLEQAGVPVVGDAERGFRIVGQPESLLAKFSKRRMAINQEADRCGLPATKGYAREADRISLRTRGKKADLPPREQLAGTWRREAAAGGWLPGAEWCRLDRASIERSLEAESDAAREVVGEAIERITEASSLFKSSEIEALTLTLAVGRSNPQAVRRALEDSFARSQLVVAGKHGLMTSQEVLRQEREIIAMIRRSQDGRSSGLTKEAQAAAISDPALRGERHATVNGRLSMSAVVAAEGKGGVEVVGPESAFAKACAADGRPMIVIARPCRAGITPGSGAIDAGALWPVNRFLADMEAGKSPLRRGDVLLLDAGCRLRRKQILGLLKGAERVGAIVHVRWGPRDVGPTSQGHPVTLISRAIGEMEARQLARQKMEWQRQASAIAQAGRIGHALKRYARHGAVSVVADTQSALEAAAAAFRAAKGDITAVAGSYKAVSRLNATLRAEAAALGLLTGPEIAIKAVPHGQRTTVAAQTDLTLRKGDRLILGGNAAIAGVPLLRGARLKVAEIEVATGQVQLECSDGQKIRVAVHEIERAGRRGNHSVPIVMQNAFAMTIRASEAETWGRTIWLPSREDRHSALVAMTRHTLAMEVVVDRSQLSHLCPEVVIEDGQDGSLITAVGRAMEGESCPRNAIDLTGWPLHGSIVPLPPSLQCSARDDPAVHWMHLQHMGGISRVNDDQLAEATLGGEYASDDTGPPPSGDSPDPEEWWHQHRLGATACESRFPLSSMPTAPPCPSEPSDGPEPGLRY